MPKFGGHSGKSSPVSNIYILWEWCTEILSQKTVFPRRTHAHSVLYITNPNTTLTWKITDFGFSSTMKHLSLRKPISFGQMTRNYFAPELLISSRSDSKADIWSAGCILYKLAVGTPAFASDEAVREYAWSGRQTPRVLQFRTDLGDEIEKIIGRMLDISPEIRPDATTVLRYITEAEGRWALAQCAGHMITV